MAEPDNLILTAVGPDKIGLVEMISEFILSRRSNIEDSKMAVFCGEFAIILLISGGVEELKKIAADYPELARQSGLDIRIRSPSRKKPAEGAALYRLAASCLDHPGVVYRLSRILSGFSINIESMETKTYPAPDTGTLIFRLEAVVSVPAGVDMAVVRSRLEKAAKEEEVDIELAPAADFLRGAKGGR